MRSFKRIVQGQYILAYSWNSIYNKQPVNISMPYYSEKAPYEFQHTPLTKKEYAP